MKPDSIYSGIQRVVHLSTNIGTQCEHCRIPVGLEDLAKSVNHYIEQHGYTLLHVGAETVHDQNGNPWNTTVAVLGIGE